VAVYLLYYQWHFNREEVLKMQQFVVYANTSIVVPIGVSADSAEEALDKGEQIFNNMTDEEIIFAGMIGAPLDGVFCVQNREGDVILEKV